MPEEYSEPSIYDEEPIDIKLDVRLGKHSSSPRSLRSDRSDDPTKQPGPLQTIVEQENEIFPPIIPKTQ